MRSSQAPRSPDSGSLPLAVRRHPLVARVHRRLCSRCGLGRDAGELTLVAGVSGGADSASLLLALATIADREPVAEATIRPVAVHVHHHLRDSADDDATWVEEFCTRLGINLHVEHVHPGQMPGNLAANARASRYEALCRVARQEGAAHIVVGHHADDQLETMMMALGRGAGLDGLTGMPWQRVLEDGVSLLRPLLDTRHAECEELCRVAGVSWREDPGNLDPASTRARVRQEIAPTMESLWPDAALRVSALGDLVDATTELLERHLAEVFGAASTRSWERDALRAVAVPIIGAGLRRAALDEAPQVADELGRRHLDLAAEAILDPERRPREFDWPRGLKLIVNAKEVILKRDASTLPPK